MKWNPFAFLGLLLAGCEHPKPTQQVEFVIDPKFSGEFSIPVGKIEGYPKVVVVKVASDGKTVVTDGPLDDGGNWVVLSLRSSDELHAKDQLYGQAITDQTRTLRNPNRVVDGNAKLFIGTADEFAKYKSSH